MLYLDQELQPQAVTVSNDSLSLLTFRVAGQQYGVPVDRVFRIIEMVTITHLPEAPASIQGLINLHGKAVPVMDLHVRFGLPRPAYGLHTPIVLVNTARADQGTRPLGLVVDSVQEVVQVGLDEIETNETLAAGAGDTPKTSDQGQASYLAGVVKVEREMILLLNVPVLLRSSELASLFAAMAEG